MKNIKQILIIMALLNCLAPIAAVAYTDNFNFLWLYLFNVIVGVINISSFDGAIEKTAFYGEFKNRKI